MSNVVREDINPTQAILTVHLARADYEPILQKKLKEYRQKVQLRGFRKGMAPMGMLRKLYGQGILADIVTEEMNRRLFDYLNDSKVDYLAEPMIREDGMDLDFDIDMLKDYSVRFDLGLRPQFELQGWDASITAQYPEVTPTEEDLDNIIKSVRRERGKQEEMPEGQVEENDLVEIHLEEWENDAKKEGGVHSHAVIGIEEELEDGFRKQVLGKKIGDTFQVDPYQIEKGRSIKWVREHILHLKEDAPETGNAFLARVDKITRVTPAEMTPAFFQEATGVESIQDEDAFRAFWRERFPGYFQRDVQAFLGMQMRSLLLSANPIPLPEDILRRWAVQRSADEKEPRQWSEQDLENFVINIRYSILVDTIARAHEIKVSQEDLLIGQMRQLHAYFGGNADENMLRQLAANLLEKEEVRTKLAHEVLNDKIVEAFYQVVTLKKEQVPSASLYDWITGEMQKLENMPASAQVS